MPLSPRRVPRYYDEDIFEEGSGSQARRAEQSDNAMLDAWEASTRVLLDRELAPQVKARFERLISKAADHSGEPTKKVEPAPTAPDHLTLATVLATCRVLQRFKLTADQHAAIGLLKTWLLGQMRGSKC